MKRLKVILALALALGMMVTIFVAPALANNNNNNDLNCRDARGNLIRCDGDLFRPVNDNNFHRDCCGFDNDINFVVFNPFGFNTFDNCGHWEWHWVFDRWEWEDDCD